MLLRLFEGATRRGSTAIVGEESHTTSTSHMDPTRETTNDLRSGLHARLRLPPSRATVPGSLPVLFFGDLHTARVATVGLNPSDQEYTTPDGAILTGAQQRFANLVSLGARDRAHLTDTQCDVALATMRGYFGPTKPVYGWFRALSRVMVGFGADFADGSAVHLDLVQESTRPVWSQLPEAERTALLARDLPFLEWQIRAFPLQAVLCTSKTVGDAVRTRFGVEPHRRGELQRVSWWVGRTRVDDRDVTFAGWNLPLARPTGLSAEDEVELGRQLADRLTAPLGSASERVRCDLPTRPAADEPTANGEQTMRRVRKDQPISRREFERALAEWHARAQAHDTIGDTTGRGQTAWIHVFDDGNLYFLNADSTKAGVNQYLGMLALAPELAWTIVLNQRGRPNKVAFGNDATKIPGFFFYVED